MFKKQHAGRSRRRPWSRHRFTLRVLALGIAAIGIDATAWALTSAAVSSTIVAESVPNGRVDAGETIGMSLCITNTDSTPGGMVTGTVLATGGVTSPTGPQSYGTVNPGAIV
ncbi:MAG: hypothetical protein FJW27_14705 [Acidimicrobiia bacterium]|nr:hypothetical protein [Acidimicrobiia bacterium]